MAVVLVLRPNGLLGRPARRARGAAPRPWCARRAPRCGWAGPPCCWPRSPPLVAGPYALSVLTEAVIAVLFAASLHFMMGPGGMPSFGHAAWFGIGAYAAGLLAQRWARRCRSACCGAAGGRAVGGAVRRVRGAPVRRLPRHAHPRLRADRLGGGVPVGRRDRRRQRHPRRLARRLGRRPAAFYWLALALCAAAPCCCGGCCTPRSATRCGRPATPRCGRRRSGSTPPAHPAGGLRRRGGRGGAAGGLFAYRKGSVFPTYVSIPRSVDALLMVLLGGVQTIAGPIVGALAYTGLYDGLLRATDLWRLVLGAAIVAAGAGVPRRHRAGPAAHALAAAPRKSPAARGRAGWPASRSRACASRSAASRRWPASRSPSPPARCWR